MKTEPVRISAEHLPILESLTNGVEAEEPPSPSATLKNAVRILETEAEFIGMVWFDDFLCRPMTGNPAREWADADDLELNIRLQTKRGFSRIGLQTVRNAALTVAFRNRGNCLISYLNSGKWDGEPRIEHFFQDHFGARGNAYSRRASQNFWLSIVARAYRPGCQVDNMIVLEGPQGSRKSSALRVIGGEWFSEQHETITGKGFFEVLQSKLLVEISEMDSFSRAEVTRVKQVITCTSDRYRDSYGHHAKDHPRQCVFVGTTNRTDWNKDETGARRFWPIACADIDVEAIAANRDQFFAEAVHRFKAGETWWEMPEEETRQEQEHRFNPDVWQEDIADYVRLHETVTVRQVLIDLLKFEVNKIDKSSQMRVATCLRLLGWEKGDARLETGKVTKVWRLKDGL